MTGPLIDPTQEMSVPFGRTLPARCKSGFQREPRQLFMLTAVDGANNPGLYQCTGNNTWELIGGSNEPAFILDPNGGETDRSGDPNNQTNTGVGGDNTPIVFTGSNGGFGRREFWTEVHGDPLNTTLSFDASGRMTCTGVGPQDTNPKLFFTGVASRFRIFPDDNGFISFECAWDSFVEAPAAAAGTVIGLGLGIFDNGRAHLQCFAIGHNGAGANAQAYTFESTDPKTTPLNVFNAVDTGQATATLTSGRWQANLDFFAGASQAQLWVDPFNWEVNGGGFTALAVTKAYEVGFNTIGGLQVQVGLFGVAREPDFSGRFTSFTLNNGRISI